MKKDSAREYAGWVSYIIITSFATYKILYMPYDINLIDSDALCR